MTATLLEQAIEDILAQVRAEIICLREAGYVGQVIIHVGKMDLSVEAASKRKYPPVQTGEKQP